MSNLTETLFSYPKPWDSPAAVATGEIDVVFDCHPRKVKSSHNTTGREARPGDELADEIG